ncbi:triosephosphate isomerase, putative [Ichthyophthirius multifiliis]|uniref:Triosephosphate isomerase n=1 Tax=Ichthyophthirius multifiliis TaxID=5932 RepID=G0QPK0_ICHMU|nr:triosephosphate isomerase, putative [Ichthyophthirius multifiliis]EGR32851.1 triosephosphate isomerase, putative [Ichthyophthirius multifiliis]|eukprot:XP_004036837.1 triosephosphate isomerase, putative [Ichthyophthirius multifiliis]
MQGQRKFFVGGNWKCNNTLQQSKDLVNNVLNNIKFDNQKVEVVVSPVSVHIPWVQENIQKTIQVAAQNSSATGQGAYTGELSVQHLIDLGLKWVILGHSERRQYYHETNDLVASKVKLAVDNHLQVIACVGESLAEREANRTNDVVKEQLQAIKSKLSEADWVHVVIAYEPVWAIGTGKVASPEQAQEVHDFIRKYLTNQVSQKAAQETRIIYGGSVTEKNCNELISQKDIDGFLVGGASLKAGFADIVASCNNSQQK